MGYKIVISWKIKTKEGIGDEKHKDFGYYLKERWQAKVKNKACKAEFRSESPEEVAAFFLELEDLVTEKVSYRLSPCK